MALNKHTNIVMDLLITQSINKLRRMTLSTVTLSKMKYSIMDLIMTLSMNINIVMDISLTLSINKTQQNDTQHHDNRHNGLNYDIQHKYKHPKGLNNEH